jgi:K+-sensing histidine kinase KdpD
MRVDSVLQVHRGWVKGVAVVLPLVACSVFSGFRESVLNTNVALGLVLLIVAAAATGIRAAGLGATLSSAAWFDFFLTPPFSEFAIRSRGDIETAALLVLVGIAVTEISLWGRRQQARASREAGYLNGVVSTAAAVGAGFSSTTSLIEHVEGQIVEVLGIDGCRFSLRLDEPVLATLENDASVVYNGRPLDVARRGLPTDTAIALAVESGGTVRGQFILTAASVVVRPTGEQLRVAIALANQVGAALAVSDTEGRPPVVGLGSME